MAAAKTACLTTVRHGELSHRCRGPFCGSSSGSMASSRPGRCSPSPVCGPYSGDETICFFRGRTPSTGMTRTADRLMALIWSSALSLVLEGFAAYPVGAYPTAECLRCRLRGTSPQAHSATLTVRRVREAKVGFKRRLLVFGLITMSSARVWCASQPRQRTSG